MAVKLLRVVGGFLYYVGALTLLPISMVFVASTNMLLLAGHTLLLLLFSGIMLGGLGKWMLRKANSLDAKNNTHIK